MSYKHLTQKERYFIYHMKIAGWSAAKIGRRIGSVFWNNPMTDVRFRSLPLRFSSQLLVRSICRCGLGIAKTLNPSGKFVSIQAARSCAVVA